VAETIEGKVVIVTGSGGGIGSAICRVFKEANATVVPFYRDSTEFNELRKKGAIREGEAGVKIDVTREEEIDGAIERVCRDYGTIDILINNAGVGFFGPIDTIESIQWKEMVDVNLTATFLLTRSVVGVMKERGDGVIINIASLTGLKGYPKCSAYGATKAGVIGLTRSLAEELIPHGIHVVAICPGSVDTPFQDNIPKLLPREKMLKPEDVARTALFVATLPERAMIEDVVIRPRVI
jgi:NAD(P)-dependent dehydrogenase (short-subunit alcohol dehydrogenase family)